LVNNYANGIASVGFYQNCCVPFLKKHNGTSVKLFDRVLNPREIRRRLGLNQEQFWTQIGVTQSGGSRYESGREMPKPVRELLRLVHVEQIDLSQVKRVDFEIISYLKESHPDLYRSLRRAVRSKHKNPDGEPALLADDEILHEHADATEEAAGSD
jgi:transcriptional regulator with XRE-family HTH domain